MEEFISIELPCNSITKMIAYCYHRLRETDLSNEERLELEDLEKLLYKERGMLYTGTVEQTKEIIMKTENVYCPFLKNHVNNDGRNLQDLYKIQELYTFAV
jgi:hypothetical protein